MRITSDNTINSNSLALRIADLYVYFSGALVIAVLAYGVRLF